MARKTSPFAALTNEERQIKWLEYQSIRLPYTKAGVDDWHKEHQQSATAAAETQAEPESSPSEATRSSRPLPPPEVYVQRRGSAPPAPAAVMPNPANMHQKTRHQQYDAVIARMKQAELRTSQYHSWSK